MEKIKIEDDFIRLDSFLKLAGAVNSGGKAKREVQSGLVAVNGETCAMRGKKLRSGDRVEYKGRLYEVFQ